MTVSEHPDVRRARTTVARWRDEAAPAALATALEDLATAATEGGDLGTAAASLEEAAGLWDVTGDHDRHGHTLLLAAATQRLRGDLGAARHDLERALAVPDLPDAVLGALEMERAEQDLAGGEVEAARQRFGAVVAKLAGSEDALVLARVLQRRAAAAVAAEAWRDAARDLMDAEAIFLDHGHRAEGEAAALGAAVSVAHVDPAVGEEVWAGVVAQAPADGAVAAQRGIVGGRVAMLAGDPALALRRFDDARAGALDAGDPIAYLMAASEAARAAESLDDDVTAYERLATAWASIGDLLGAEAGRQLTRPLLEQLRDRLGPGRFDAARAAYEAARRHRAG
ncbi:hypothetical protein [Georgenia wangjunii]|uniref:hypothetical protein n=1 Tax=Georgenia wangjunii TaxID=3117730 RepID=UPI002F26B3C3